MNYTSRYAQLLTHYCLEVRPGDKVFIATTLLAEPLVRELYREMYAAGAAVVVVLSTEHFVMLSRNLLYTAVTRGKRLVVLVAAPLAIRISLSEVRKDERCTRLAELLGAGRSG